MNKLILAGFFGLAAIVASAEIQIIDGVKYECKDGLCMIVEEDAESGAVREGTDSTVGTNGTVNAVGMSDAAAVQPCRMAQGYMSAKDFARWLEGNDEPEDVWMTTPMTSAAFWIGLLMILLGGLAMNLTPCVLPMIPINLMIIGKSAARGAWYGLGIALAYGTLGVAAAIGGLAFGTIQGNPWFNLGIAILFIVLGLALSGAFFIDLSKSRSGLAQKKTTMLPWLFAFFMGVVSAVLAGACVAPILISVLLLTGKLYAEGNALALGLPFVLGLGMALPWPFLGAGLKVLPKPGAWMKWVNRLFALLVFGFAVWYGRLAWLGFAQDMRQETGDANGRNQDARLSATPETFEALLANVQTSTSTSTSESTKPILVDCWATWCKNCAAMEKVFEEPEVKKALEGYTVIRMQAEDMKALRALKGFESIRGLPAFVILGGRD